jgi:hypothetical protein
MRGLGKLESTFCSFYSAATILRGDCNFGCRQHSSQSHGDDDSNDNSPYSVQMNTRNHPSSLLLLKLSKMTITLRFN